MARNDSTRKPKKDRSDDPDPDLLAHIRSLGLSTVADYLGWCARHGFSRRTDKHWRIRLKERSYAHRAIAEARLAQKKQEIRRPEKVIERIFNGELREAQVTDPHWKAVCRACRSAQESPQTRAAFHQLLQQVSVDSGVVSSQPVIGQYGWQAGNSFVDGLLALARHSQNWIRPAAAWKPQTHNPRRQFASLARHLFVEWPVPSFMDSVWFLGNGREAVRRQGWFRHIGSGQNIRTADLPLPYTKRMAHHFLQAPADCTVEAALRWGQILGLGGSERLVRAVIGTRLGTDYQNDDFWATVLQFLIANPMLDLAHVGPIIDYIHQQRFVSQDVFVAPGVVERRDPAQPNFTMKGRTPASLLRQVEAWHRTLAKSAQPKAEWPRSEIDGFEFVEGAERGGNLKIWTITELLSTKALVAEGRKMKHCVATYAHSCASGACSIWTLEAETFEGRAKILTVEVQNQARLICQARGKCNMLPGEKHRGILRRWAAKTGLSLANHV
jgi:hypothetical protein